MLRRLSAEAAGTFTLVLCGTGAVVVDAASGGAVTNVGIALVFGLVVFALVQTLGDVSGAHLNPAVTLGFVAARRFPLRSALAYVPAQLAGALAASGTIAWMFPADATLGATLPAIDVPRVLVLEALITGLLMSVILGVSDGARERGLLAGLAIGGTVALAALFAGPITGASMNPARSFGPAVVSGHTAALWVYLVAPVVGALTAAPLCRWLRGPACCWTEGAEGCAR